MLKHIVMWKLKDNAEGNTNIKNALFMKEMLETLKDVIPEIEMIEVGLNVNSSAAAYDVVLYSEFKDEEALKTYQDHPEHLKVAEFVGKINEDRVVVDYLV
ncbi:Dabb family protein [Methanolobus profundi]|uniref:Stress responsive A/B Barrel Domain n=1 Tax=Methanolobus profundi TaxID=487685 RepID=A0A1I4PE58_9EURY|nr:Dabb family protein [Methanolobus profundi]SFM25957.1 Stress responsive A/B Barrel Domain [Methanolobus profundi]